MTELAYRAPRTPLVEPAGIDHHVADMTATFAADVTLAEAQARLAQAAQWLPIDGDPARPLGFLVESNSTGPLRLGYGAWRDLLLGCQFTNGTGELITAGGRTMKNVAGYDLTKLMIGQHRIFGRLVTLTARTYKRPEQALVAHFAPDVRIVGSMMITEARPQWCALTRDELICGYLADARTIAYYESFVGRYRPIGQERLTIDQEIALRARLWRPGSARVRASVPPARIREFIDQTDLADWVADPAFGVVLGSCEPGGRGELFVAAERMGGTVVLHDGSGRATNVSTDPSIQMILGRIKEAFDPHGNLRPLPASES